MKGFEGGSNDCEVQPYRALSDKIDDLPRAVSRLTLLHVHDGLFLLTNCVSMLKQVCILRTSICSGNPFLEKFDAVFKECLK